MRYTDTLVAAVPLAELVPARVDWFVLDVEGAEHQVLEHFPWRDVAVRVWTIESNKWPRGRATLHTLMVDHGFSCLDFDTINTVCTSCTRELRASTRAVCA